MSPRGEIYDDLDPKGKASERDSEFYKRLREVCFQYWGRWKRWISFYDITYVRENQMTNQS